MRRISPSVCLAALAGLLAACSPGAPAVGDDSKRTEIARSGGTQSGCLTRAYPEIGGPIALTAHTGAAVTEADFKGRMTMVYFGFTYCPDVCPLTLTTLAAAYRQLPAGVAPPQTVLITVDPGRDTPEALATYVATAAFPKGLIGLTGSDTQVRAAADAFKADYERIEQPDSLSGYTMDHTSLLYLMDEDWKLTTFFTHQDTPETIADCLATIAARKS